MNIPLYPSLGKSLYNLISSLNEIAGQWFRSSCRAGTSLLLLLFLLPPFLDIDYSICNRSFIEVDNVACLEIVSKPARSTVRCSSTNYVWESSYIQRRRGKFTDETATSWSLCLRVSIAENSRCTILQSDSQGEGGGERVNDEAKNADRTTMFPNEIRL